MPCENMPCQDELRASMPCSRDEYLYNESLPYLIGLCERILSLHYILPFVIIGTKYTSILILDSFVNPSIEINYLLDQL